MKILHTADWHLGVSLGTEKRSAEFERTLKFILESAQEREVRCILIAGDIFDSPIPSNQAIGMYYQFLVDATRAGIRDIIVTAGNHDSPGFLEAPKELLKRLNVHVFGKLEEDPADQLVLLQDENGEPHAVVAAIPYLHERDVRRTVSGEGLNEQHLGYCKGVLAAYQKVCGKAKELYPDLPLIAMSHFWATPGTEPDPADQVGCQSGVPVGDFPQSIDYLAMGHIHWPEPLAYRKEFRYAGSILPLTFQEAGYEKMAVLLDTDDLAHPEEVKLPVFRQMEVITGTMTEITERIGKLKGEDSDAMLDVEVTGQFQPRLRQDLDDLCAGSRLSVIVCKNQEPNPVLLHRAAQNERLEDLGPETVFSRMLDGKKDLTEDRRARLIGTFREAVSELEAKKREGQEA